MITHFVAELVRLERVHNLLAGVQSRPRAVCGVANPRHSYGYVCGLRLAAHPDPHPAPLRAQIVNTFLETRLQAQRHIAALERGHILDERGVRQPQAVGQVLALQVHAPRRAVAGFVHI